MMLGRQVQTSLPAFIRKYGEEEGARRYRSFLQRMSDVWNEKDEGFRMRRIEELRRYSKISPDYYRGKVNPNTSRLYTEDEIKAEIVEHQRYAIGKAKELAKKHKDTKDLTCRQVNFWVKKGLTLEEATQKVREIQRTNTIEAYVKKYGYEIGVETWLKRNKVWSDKMRDLRAKSCGIGNAYSRSACTLFETVLNTLREQGICFEKVYYGNKEFSKWDKEFNRVYFYDLVVNDIKLCVEYNGIRFHPKPGDYDWVCLFSGKTYEEVMSYDRRKQQLIKDLGYELVVVWEDDIFEQSVEKIVAVCKKLLSRNTNG